jgi:hypothetical protein
MVIIPWSHFWKCSETTNWHLTLAKGGPSDHLAEVGYPDRWTAVEVNMEFQGVPETPVLKLAWKSFIHLIGPTAYSPLAIALGFFT